MSDITCGTAVNGNQRSDINLHVKTCYRSRYQDMGALCSVLLDGHKGILCLTIAKQATAQLHYCAEQKQGYVLPVGLLVSRLE